jgi:hypothetical protein
MNALSFGAKAEPTLNKVLTTLITLSINPP